MKSQHFKSECGMTIVEMLVAITVLGLLSGAIAAVMIAQIRSSVSQQNQAALQSDVNLAMTMMRWDMAQVGLGQPSFENTVIQSTAPAGQGDNITLMGAISGSDAGRWSVVMDSSNMQPTEVLVRMWSGNDSVHNLRANDTINAISPLKQFIGTDMIIESIDYANVPVPGQQMLLTLDTVAGTSMLAGSMISQAGTFGAGAAATASYTLDAANRRLLRNGLPLLENVEQFQVRYFIDMDDDEVIDTTAEFSDVFSTTVNPATWNFTPMMIGVTLVTSTPVTEGKQVDFHNTIDIWGSSYPLDQNMQRRYRNVHTMLVRPRNIGG